MAVYFPLSRTSICQAVGSAALPSGAEDAQAVPRTMAEPNRNPLGFAHANTGLLKPMWAVLIAEIGTI